MVYDHVFEVLGKPRFNSTFDQVFDTLGLDFNEITGLTKLERFI